MFNQTTLNTNLEHLTSKEEVKELINNNEKAVIVCGRMGPMCIPVYGIMDSLREKNQDIQFRDMLFDHPDSEIIRNLPECQTFRGLPYTVYFKNGKVVKATSSIKNAKQVKEIIKEVF
ncbi:MAG: hypothetical protein HeimC3_09060 [Candidatus Heimdallarchaeota archaeon LC_3]|nr:MAG: hypothetical protein HeimC3_09060 [Candidatus Heimdallarchaeota archaeon LC_3]